MHVLRLLEGKVKKTTADLRLDSYPFILIKDFYILKREGKIKISAFSSNLAPYKNMQKELVINDNT